MEEFDHPAERPPATCLFLNLPVELQIEILSYCPRGSFGRIAKTCRQFYDICLREHLRTIEIRATYYSAALEKLTQRPHLRSAVRDLTVYIEKPDTWPYLHYSYRDGPTPFPGSRVSDRAFPEDRLYPRFYFSLGQLEDAISRHFFDNVRSIRIEAGIEFVKSFVPTLLFIKHHRPERLEDLSIRLEDVAYLRFKDEILARAGMGRIQLPGGLKSLDIRISEYLTPWDMADILGPSADTLTFVDIDTCFLRQRCRLDDVVVCPNVKVLKVGGDCFKDALCGKVIDKMFPNVESLYLNPSPNLNVNAWDIGDCQWCSGFAFHRQNRKRNFIED
ncbi:hypothetical protein TWF506_009343 [Arthrobotrys conoides]|uniref:F-box domain-containing protein n=1 Tax=Arthrobotrys conoides TaxID=74498 RepID=A0AAN8RM90_9PEZI